MPPSRFRIAARLYASCARLRSRSAESAGARRPRPHLPHLLCGALAVCCCTQPAAAQRHPMEIRAVYPLGAAAGATTRVTITGMSLRDAGTILFSRSGVTARVVESGHGALPTPTLDTDGNPPVIADVTVAADTPPGIVSFRVASAEGISNAHKLVIGWRIPQSETPPSLETQQTVSLPIAMNGRVLSPGDRHSYQFDLEAGRTLVAAVQAAIVDSPLDSLLTLRDPTGREVASNDDDTGPDSLLVYSAPTTGRYTLTLSSAVGAGGPEYAFRVSIGYLPLLRALYPSSIALNTATSVHLIGLNVPPLAEAPGAPVSDIHAPGTPMSNALPLYYSAYPTVQEREPNDTAAQATPLPAPGIASGQFLRADGASDIDFYRFHASAGQRFLIDVQCQAIGSVADPMLTLLDSNGKSLMENDDANGRDSHLDFTAPQTADYLLRIREATGRSAPEMVYRLLVLPPPSPGFTLTVESRGRALGQGDFLALEVTVARDRFDGPVTLMATGLPAGVSASPVVVPPGVSRGLLILSALPAAMPGAFPLQITGTARIGGRTITQPLSAVSDWVWQGGARRVVPAPPELRMLAVGPPAELALTTTAKEIRLAPNGSVKIPVHLDRRIVTGKPITLRALGLPDGVTVADIVLQPGQNTAELELKATPAARLGASPISVLALVSVAPNVQVERFSAPVTLTVAR